MSEFLRAVYDPKTESFEHVVQAWDSGKLVWESPLMYLGPLGTDPHPSLPPTRVDTMKI